MKIGILTYIGTQSHGCCLQAYALRKLLSERKIDAEIINYHCPAIDNSVKFSKLPRNQKTIKSKLGSLKRLPILRSRWRKFKDFETDYLNIGSEIYYPGKSNEYDYYVVGSDQVWNTDVNGYDTTFFLDFVSDDTKKLSYAASLGLEDFPQDKRQKCIELISKFNKINVREETLKNLLINAGIKNINRVLDPTLVYSRANWIRLVGERSISEKYIFVHLPAEGNDVIKSIKDIALERNLKIVYASNPIKKIRGFKCKYAVSPIEYLNLLYHSDIVITGSFHSLCFSLIFNKEFYCTESMIAERKSRINDLMVLAKCDDRLLQNYKLFGNHTHNDYYLNLESDIKQSELIIDSLFN